MQIDVLERYCLYVMYFKLPFFLTLIWTFLKEKKRKKKNIGTPRVDFRAGAALRRLGLSQTDPIER